MPTGHRASCRQDRLIASHCNAHGRPSCDDGLDHQHCSATGQLSILSARDCVALEAGLICGTEWYVVGFCLWYVVVCGLCGVCLLFAVLSGMLIFDRGLFFVYFPRHLEKIMKYTHNRQHTQQRTDNMHNTPQCPQCVVSQSQPLAAAALGAQTPRDGSRDRPSCRCCDGNRGASRRPAVIAG